MDCKICAGLKQTDEGMRRFHPEAMLTWRLANLDALANVPSDSLNPLELLMQKEEGF